jgi:hypothetical protein
MARLFDCDCNMSNLVISLLVDVTLDVVGDIDDDPYISFDVGSRKGLGKRLGEE